jgi:hypothetical protein
MSLKPESRSIKEMDKPRERKPDLTRPTPTKGKSKGKAKARGQGGNVDDSMMPNDDDRGEKAFLEEKGWLIRWLRECGWKVQMTLLIF